MNNDCYETIWSLPNILFYGGESDRFEIIPYDKDGARLTPEYAALCDTKLTVSPLSIRSGLGNNHTPVTPVIEKDGAVELDDDNNPVFVFCLTANDTKELWGIYVYQIDISNGDSSARVYQGKMHIVMNIDQ